MHQQLSKRQQEQINELNSKMAAEIQELMTSNKMPSALIHPLFADWLTCALPHETTKTMAVSYADFKKFWTALQNKPVSEYNLWEMGFAINCVESKSMLQLNLTTPEAYIKIQDAIEQMAVSWNQIVNAIKAPVTDKNTRSL